MIGKHCWRHRTKKLRVILAREDLLEETLGFIERGESPTLKIKYFAGRWDTVKNMARLFAEKKKWKNSPLRDIELVMPNPSRNPQQDPMASPAHDPAASPAWGAQC